MSVTLARACWLSHRHLRKEREKLQSSFETKFEKELRQKKAAVEAEARDTLEVRTIALAMQASQGLHFRCFVIRFLSWVLVPPLKASEFN